MIQDRTKWRWFIALAALEAGAAFVALAWLPREGHSISPARAAMLAALAACSVLGMVLAYRPPRWLALLTRTASILSIGLLSLLVGFGLFLLRYLDPAALLPYYQRSEPLLLYVLILGLEASVFLLILRFGLHRVALLASSGLVMPVAVAFAALVVVLVFVAISRVGLTPDSAYWGEPGVPVLGWQLILALIAGLGFLLACISWPTPGRMDFFIAAGVWLLAVGVWLSVPAVVTRNSFYAPITPPDSQPYPNSDAGYYDSMAESLVIGQPYQGQIPTRPLYIVFLTLLHLLAGENYGLIVLGQTLILAFIPVVLYFLGKALHSRATGLIVALIAIFREWTTVIVSSQTRVSDSRTLLVDLPTLLLVLVACLLSVRWVARRDLKSGFLAGGVFGLLLLLRTQALLIAPFLLIVVVLAFGLRSRAWIVPVLAFTAALVVAVAPWLIHNYLQSGQLTFDAPFQYQIIVSQYQYTGNLDINNVDLQGKSVAGILITFLLRDPRFVLGFIATHFLATQIGGLLALPLFHSYPGLTAPLDLYWVNWNGQLSAPNLLLLLGYLLVIAIGLGTSWARLHWAGVVPLVFSLSYSLANGVARFSGWRYDLPADWVWYFYFAIGASQILAAFALLLGAAADKLLTREDHTPARPLSSRWLLLILAGLALVGSLPWLAEGLSFPHYTVQEPTRLVAEVGASPALAGTGTNPAQLMAFASSPSSIIQSGRLLYPRFFTRDLGLASAHPWPAYAPRDFPRLGFLLLNQTRHDVIFPGRPPDGTFPQAADVIVLGCQRADYIEARMVFFPALDSAYLSAPLDQPCE